MPSLDDSVKTLLEPSDAIKKSSEKCLKKIRDLFELEKVETSKKGGEKRTGQSVFGAAGSAQIRNGDGASATANGAAASNGTFSLDLDSSQVKKIVPLRKSCFSCLLFLFVF